MQNYKEYSGLRYPSASLSSSTSVFHFSLAAYRRSMSAQRVRHLMKVSLLFLIGLSSIEGQKLNITANISPSGGLCQNSVTFSCTAIGVEDGTFSWYLNGDAIGSRVYDPGDIYPFTVNSSIAEFFIQMMDVTLTNRRLFNFINFTLTIQLMKISNYVGQNITCGQILIQSSQITISSYHLQAPKAPNADDINFIAHYDHSTSIVSKVTVNWNVLEEFCTELNYEYEVRLTSNSAILYSINETCKVNTDCQVTFMIMPVLMVNVYWIEIAALDEDGVVSNVSRCPDPIDIQPNISVKFLSCAVVKCYSTFNGTCEIQYSQNVTTPLNDSVNGEVNSDDIEVKGLQSGMVFYVATFNVNGNAYILQSHTTVKCERKEKKMNLNGGALAAIIIAVLIVILSFILVPVVLILCKILRKKGVTQSTQKLSSVQTTIETYHVTSLAVDDMGMSEAEKTQVHGHRKIGEGKKAATLRVRDEITGAVKEMQEPSTNMYSTTQHGNSTQTKLSQFGSQISSNTYSILNRAKNAVKPQDSSEYSVLQHNQGKSTDPVSSVAVTGSTSSDVPGSTSRQYGQLNTESVSSHDNKHEEAKNTYASLIVTDNDGQKLVNGSKSSTDSTV